MKPKIREFNAIFDSFVPYLKSDLHRIDGRIQQICREASMCSIPSKVIEKELNRRWTELFLQVAGEHREKVAG